jgi:hypothetical protein
MAMGQMVQRIAEGLVIAGAIVAAAAAAHARSTQMGAAPSGLGAAIDRDVARARAATERFTSTDVAVSAGYQRITDCLEHPPDGAMGYHFQNNALLDTTLDVEHPEVLVYERRPDGGFTLNGVEYLVPISAWKAAQPPRIMGQALKRADALGIWYLHVWTRASNPSGLFADWNPRVTCGKDGDASSMRH